MANDFLDRIVAYKRELIALKADYYRSLRAKIELSKYTPYHLFENAISGRDRMNLIAEIKKA
ncbi:MAG: hypothetical protein K8I00_00355, partial [Candidatus Omnitrophica bacterium]|nr:hypothetical protein [Candidatus Omnitrophota bacterium]